MTVVTRFENAPLVEVIAELRWNTAADNFFQQATPGLAFQVPDAVAGRDEAFFGSFAEKADDLGFRSIERLLPQGSPSFPGQATVRFRRRANTPPLLQVGPGVFTANGLPPTYTHWGDFRPLLEDGVKALLGSRPIDEQQMPFALTVRYIDSFRASFWQDEGRVAFIQKLLGFGLSLPSSVTQKLDLAQEGRVVHQFGFPIADGSSLQIQIGDGATEDASEVVLLNMSAQHPQVPADLDAVMKQFEEMHRLLRDVFDSLIEPIREQLRPVEVTE